LDKFIDHYKKVHVNLLRDENTRLACKELLPIIEHFAESFGVAKDQPAVEFTTLAFNGPISGINEPVERVTCLACSTSLQDKKNAQVHWQACRSKYPSFSQSNFSDRTKPEFTQRPFSFNKKGSYVAVPGPLPHDVSQPCMPDQSACASGPLSERYVIPHGPESIAAPWLQILAWPAWRDKQAQAGLSAERLVSFVALPPTLYGGKTQVFSSPPTELETFDWVGRRIHGRLKKMMADANTFLDSCNGELRDNLTAEWVYTVVI
jgi:hypothetical protein